MQKAQQGFAAMMAVTGPKFGQVDTDNDKLNDTVREPAGNTEEQMAAQKEDSDNKDKANQMQSHEVTKQLQITSLVLTTSIGPGA